MSGLNAEWKEKREERINWVLENGCTELIAGLSGLPEDYAQAKKRMVDGRLGHHAFSKAFGDKKVLGSDMDLLLLYLPILYGSGYQELLRILKKAETEEWYFKLFYYLIRFGVKKDGDEFKFLGIRYADPDFVEIFEESECGELTRESELEFDRTGPFQFFYYTNLKDLC